MTGTEAAVTAVLADASGGGKLLTEVVRLNGALKAAPLPLDLPGVDAMRESRAQLIEQLEDYVIPRLMTLDAPLLTVVGGSTGAGKSTLVNSLVGHRVTTPGVLRPTTRSPVLVHHPEEGHWFGPDRLLPDLKRVAAPTTDQDSIQLVASDSVPRGIAILDAPDVDSVDARNRELAGQLLAAADLWLFVTSSARYADQVPWEYLKQAVERSTAVALILDRTPAESVSTVSAHLARMMASRGLKDSPLFGVAEGPVDDDGLLPAGHVADVRGWLEALADDAPARRGVVNQTVGGAVRTVTRKAYPIADAATAQVDAVAGLLATADRVYDEATASLQAAGRDGSMLRGELLARWQEFVGSGELVRSLDAKVGFVRERLVNAIKGKPQQAERVAIAIEVAYESLAADRAELAAATASAAWSGDEHGRALLSAATDDLSRAGRALRTRAAGSARDWQAELQALVKEGSGDVRATARFLALGVRGLAIALAVVTLGEAAPQGPANESVRLGRNLLETVVGAEATDAMVAAAGRSLEERLGELLAGERERYLAPAQEWELTPEAPEQLRHAARRVDDLRFAAKKEMGERW
ncbi:ABC transporter [Nocardioides sp. GY 10113]|uniref:dynamin family protein n=1 Tax=Nocardioides sp. GY 10113 TaxID=2569761 RepID=UPI0010A85EF2|nr:dynamin family protein [Nocardioides sp. GY 10113]TIC87442.1 ABC transporter [Nocardioides sp. GY 10113]